MSSTIADERIRRGMQKQLARRRERIQAGERPIGWKVGFGTQAAMEKLGTKAPLVGYLMESGLLESGGSVSLAGWTKPVAEPEIAIHIGRDLDGDADDEEARAAIAALGPAIELADLHPPPEELESVLAGNIFQRHVILGAANPSRAGGSVAGLIGRAIRNGAEVASIAELETNTGGLLMITRLVADTLAACGERLRRGDVIIAGSVVPPVFLDANDISVEHRVDGLGSALVRFSRQ